MKRPLIIAVDGPAAVGKGTLASKLSRILKVPHLDTGLLYRACARIALDRGEDITNATRMADIAKGVTMTDLSRCDLRTPEIDLVASRVASLPKVRDALIAVQRQFVANRGGVVDGRDIGTKIFPDAPVKLFITASRRVRALRRWRQIHEGQQEQDPDEEAIDKIEKAIRERDQLDSSRNIAPLRAARDAVVIKTDTLSPDEVLVHAMQEIKKLRLK